MTKNRSKESRMTNLHGEEDQVLPLELDEDRDEIGLEQARDMGAYEAVESEGVGSEALELLRHHQTLLAHLLLPPPYGQARPRRRRTTRKIAPPSRMRMKMVRESCSEEETPGRRNDGGGGGAR
ncbi:hypothetical protein TorRG33x02_064990 [Trema orientale]|uniref:Uncharacterized protein n=1 Tax=Trema orientale TaxID=63057 RepID=A0A2P5FIG8_TREOI|nr:hypothetical protein TorRG33x02_064990 [Trema orientale]